MRTNYIFNSWIGDENYEKFDVVLESNKYYYSVQPNSGQNPSGSFILPITSYERLNDCTRIHFTKTGSITDFGIGSLFSLTGVADSTFNATGAVVRAGAGWIEYTNAGRQKTTTAASVGAINCSNPAWTTGFFGIPSYSMSIDSTPNVIQAMFGEGYSQRQRTSLNAPSQKFELTFENRSDKEARALANFTEDKYGVDSFKILTPASKLQNNPDIKYLGKSVKVNPSSFNLNNVSITVEQVFDI